ncbi:hypothetical protein [Umezawaea beigongshangensis]|uniref:hypothetical protein n=1 Tax=Umezawaea beigongshangensis TaxID=2780383 RepID=UPI0018F250B9|nr:hypothetical protein [Umezawaea beigongshangensis]
MNAIARVVRRFDRPVVALAAVYLLVAAVNVVLAVTQTAVWQGLLGVLLLSAAVGLIGYEIKRQAGARSRTGTRRI